MKRLTPEEIQLRLNHLYDGLVSIDASTYKNTAIKARFIHSEFGEWFSRPNDVLNGHCHRMVGNKNRKNTCMRKYGVSHISKSQAIRDRIKETVLSKYGVENPNQSKQIREKSKSTCLDRYGTDNPFGSKKIKEKIVRTNRIKYGVDYPSQNKEIALKQARKQCIKIIKYHWKTGEELICLGSYESKTVDYLNTNKIDFDWQPKVFTMSSGKTYRPDLYLVDDNRWIEIKGYMREKNKEKWDWFQSIMPNSELWNKTKLKEMGIL